MEFLKGKKTYILVTISIVVWGSQAMGWITSSDATKILELLGAGAIATLRAALPQ